MSKIKKMEVFFTDAEGKKTKVLEVFLPYVEFSTNHPINTYYHMGSFSPVHEHTGQIEFTFKGNGLTMRPRKAKKPKPLSKRAQKALEERIASQEGWED